MSAEASLAVLEVAPNPGSVPIIGNTGPDMYHEVVDVFNRRGPVSGLKRELFIFSAKGSLAKLQELLDDPNLDQMPENVLVHNGIGFSADCVMYGGLMMLSAARPMLNLVAEASGLLDDQPVLFDGMLHGNYARSKSAAKKWHMDVLAEGIGDDVQAEYLWGYPDGVHAYTGGEIDTDTLVQDCRGKGLTAAIKHVHASVVKVIKPEDVQRVGSGEVAQINPRTLHTAPPSAGKPHTRATFRVCVEA